ncbi:transcriptional regulator [Halostreptopolyspora alba]|uniref:Transcriptional regulator n=1 Tax=Halostreptopolyspora alba TaxID=2487137 RepID=A0A3N0EDD4_9ACTN|nr:transcriptional regulator [Nocardiopsaceae bacterium YIM 96095]
MAASPTLRRRRLARQLLKLRADKGSTVEAVAKEAKKRSPNRPWSAAKVTRIEGRKLQQLREVDLLTLLDIYGVTDSEERDAYVRLAKEASQSGWWVGYRDVLGSGAYIDLETEATRLRTYEALYVPGLLQTPGYAEAITRGSGVTDDHEVARRVEARMMRRQILERPDAPHLIALIDEAAVRKIPRAVLSDQLRHLIAMQRDHVQIRVVPDESGPHAAMSGSFVVMEFPNDPAVVYLEQSTSGLFLEDGQELEHYERVCRAVEDLALSADDSVAFLEENLARSR